MATYLSGSNVQADGMQTLYLMNPNYAGYSDGSNTGSMVLISPSTGGVGQGNPLINSAQQQQHYIGFPMPPGLTQNSLSQHSPLTAISNSNMGPSTNLFTNRIGNQTYNSWSGAGELPFLPTSDVTQVTQSLANRLTSVNSGQQSTSEVSQYSLRRQAISSIQEQQAPLLQSRVALGLNMDHSQSSAGPGQGLSLSLSPQQPSAIQLQSFHIQPSESGMSSCVGMPHVISEDNTNRGERFPNKWVGNLSTFRASSRDGIIGTGYQNSINAAGSSRQVHLEPSSSTIAGNGNLLQGSKYLKAAQQLLDEVVNVGRGIKTSPTKHNKLQSWIGTNSTLDGPFAKDRTLSESTVKDGTAASTAVPTSAASVLEQNTETVPELTPGERQELEMKKAKLMAMMDEVDRRYRQYYNQMQIVVTSFESAAGVGAAKTYTALALQTISRNFRSLRDAICGQIRVTSKALGEEDLPGQGFGRGETSRLRFVDQQLRQQRALQQLGVMQQHAWRPQRGLPERSVSVLRAWLFEHFLHPYPKDADKLMLARQTGLSRSQVSNWFINARVRLWKPMVEEMYLEETKEVEIGSAATAEKTRGEAEHLSKGATAIDGGGNGANLVSKQTQGVVKNKDGLSEQELASEMLQSRNQGDGLKQGVKKARNGIQDSGSLLSPNMSMDVDLKSDETGSEEIGEHENKLSNEDRHGRESYTISHNGLARSTESLGGFGSYQIGALGRYSQEGVPARYPGTSGVSLTLGLQHCEGLSLAGAQHHYFHGEGLPSGRRHDTASGSDVEDFYSINDQSNAYDAINFQNRKRFATQLLHHDFVG